MTRQAFVFLCCVLVACFALSTQLWATEPTEGSVSQDASTAPELLQPSLEELLDDPMQNEKLVCYTQRCTEHSDCTYFCDTFHAPSIRVCDNSCSGCSGCCVCIPIDPA